MLININDKVINFLTLRPERSVIKLPWNLTAKLANNRFYVVFLLLQNFSVQFEILAQEYMELIVFLKFLSNSNLRWVMGLSYSLPRLTITTGYTSEPYKKNTNFNLLFYQCQSALLSSHICCTYGGMQKRPNLKFSNLAIILFPSP